MPTMHKLTIHENFRNIPEIVEWELYAKNKHLMKNSTDKNSLKFKNSVNIIGFIIMLLNNKSNAV